MEAATLRFADRSREDLPLSLGVHEIGRHGDQLAPVASGETGAVRFCVDRRGVWLTLAEGVRGVHVNGRRIHRMAMLRVGDAIYVDGIELRLVSSRVQTPTDSMRSQTDGLADPRIVLRGVGGQYHGRSFTLDRPRLVGRSEDADIRIDDPTFADRHARLELVQDRVVLRDLGSAEGSLVNGESVRDAVMYSGDQIVFDAHHRFVVEAPRRAPANGGPAPVTNAADAAHDPLHVQPEARRPSWRLPWLLLAAVLIACMLAVLLLFGQA